LAAKLLRDELSRQFTKENIFAIRDSWQEIIRNRKASLGMRGASSPLSALVKASVSTGSEVEGPHLKKSKAEDSVPAKSSPVPSQMCTTHAKLQLGVQGARACDKSKTGCKLTHYNFSGLHPSKILGLISDHASRTGKKLLKDAADASGIRSTST
jgi:hypothetical protein